MLLAERPDLEMRSVRGNVNTRLAKLDAGEYDALVLAAAGLERLGLGGRITEKLPESLSLPAAGQGALGVECRDDGHELISLLTDLQDEAVASCVLAERAVSAGIGADCSAPLGAHAVRTDAGIRLLARLGSPDGSRMLEATAIGEDPLAIGHAVAADLNAQGAAELLADIPKPDGG
jgi:hydroxymethylbilane synthase